MDFDPTTHPHRRYNPLLGEHVLISPHRTKRPWLGQTEAIQLELPPDYDPSCYLCPGNTRSGGQKNPNYKDTFTFVNDFSAIMPGPPPQAPIPLHPMLTSEPIHGACDVIVFHPRHDLTLAQLDTPDVERVVDEWIRVYLKRGREGGIKYVQIFENKGAMMGCSNNHPHGQVWSLSEVPTIPAKELASLKDYSLRGSGTITEAPLGPRGRPCLLCEYAHTEVNTMQTNSRVVLQNSHWVALVPWWAVWPFEILLLPYRRHIPSIDRLTAPEKLYFAEILAKLAVRYDNLFNCSFAYSMGIHQQPIPAIDPSDEGDLAHLHVHFDPPLLRSANVRKFLVGYELMAEPQRDLTPEQAAEKLRGCSDCHYLNQVLAL